MDKCGTFYWTTCAVHRIDLILENMAKLDLFQINASTIEKARKIPTFICNHIWILNILRIFLQKPETKIWPSIMRFASNFISLQCFYSLKGNLGNSVVLVHLSYASSPIDLGICDILLNSSF